MIHKIQTFGNNYLSLEVKTVKSEPCLCISKDTSLLIFNYTETKQLNVIIQSIDAGRYALKEYWSVKRWLESFKISISEFRGLKNIQIRERISSPTYSGYGKQGISLSTYKLKELQMHMKTVMQEFSQ